jgi:hypothetical protein
LEKCFPNELTANGWLPKLKEIIPSYGVSLIDDADFLRRSGHGSGPEGREYRIVKRATVGESCHFGARGNTPRPVRAKQHIAPWSTGLFAWQEFDPGEFTWRR